MTLVNSRATASTRVRSGTLAATRPISCETDSPIAQFSRPNPDQARPRLARSRHVGVEGVRTVRSGPPAANGLRDGVGNEERRNADAGGVQISGRDIEGPSKGGSHAPDTTVAVINANLH